jgi:CRISPR system Cascade subunit CasE
MPRLTSLALDVRHRDVAKDLLDCNDLHRTVMRLVATDEPQPGPGATPTLRGTTNTLFRLTVEPRKAELLVQSTHPLDHSRLPHGYALTRRDLDLAPLLARITHGSTVRYTLVAAPIKNVATTDRHGHRTRGKKSPLKNLTEVTDWWNARLPRAGMEIHCNDGAPLLRIDPAPGAIGNKKHNHGQHVIRHRAFRISGIAAVTDPELACEAIVTGIGPGKAYGMGLLTVVPL